MNTYLTYFQINDFLSDRFIDQKNLNDEIRRSLSSVKYRIYCKIIQFIIKNRISFEFKFEYETTKLMFVYLTNFFEIKTHEIKLNEKDLIYLTKYSLIIDDLKSFNKWFDLLENTTKMHILYNSNIYNIYELFIFGYPYKINTYLKSLGYSLILFDVLMITWNIKKKNIKFANIKLFSNKYNIKNEIISISKDIIENLTISDYFNKHKYYQSIINRSFDLIKYLKILNLITDKQIFKIMPNYNYFFLDKIKYKIPSCYFLIINSKFKSLLKFRYFNQIFKDLKDDIFFNQKNLIWFNENFNKLHNHLSILNRFNKLGLLDKFICISSYNIIISNKVIDYLEKNGYIIEINENHIKIFIENQNFDLLKRYFDNFKYEILNGIYEKIVLFKKRNVYEYMRFLKKIDFESYNLITNELYHKLCFFYLNKQIERLINLYYIDFNDSAKSIYNTLKKLLKSKWQIKSFITRMNIDIYLFINLFNMLYFRNKNKIHKLKKLLKIKYKLTDSEVNQHV